MRLSDHSDLILIYFRICVFAMFIFLPLKLVAKLRLMTKLLLPKWKDTNCDCEAVEQMIYISIN